MGTFSTLSQEDIYLLLHWRGELSLEKLRQHLLTHQHQALLLRDGITGGQLGVAASNQAAKDVFILFCPGDWLAVWKRNRKCYTPYNLLSLGEMPLITIAG